LLWHDRRHLTLDGNFKVHRDEPLVWRVQSPTNPNYCVIDLDPDKYFDQVIEAAQMTKTILDEMGVPPFVKTSGYTGIHIYVPLGQLDWCC